MSATSLVPSPLFDIEKLASVHPKSIFAIDGASALAYDLKSPLAALAMNLEYALSELPKGEACEEAREALVDCRVAGARLAAMIMNVVDVVRAEAGKLTPHIAVVSVGTLLRSVARAASRDPWAPNVALHAEGFDGDFRLDAALTIRMLECLLDAALTGSRGDDTVALFAQINDEGLEVHVPILAAKLSAEDRARAFGKHSRFSMVGSDRRRSLYFCRVVVEAHGGTIGIAEGCDGSSFFRIVLPTNG